MINVKDYGAVGNGIADDTNPFGQAIAAAHAANDVLIIPEGVYAVSSLPNLAKDNFAILGVGSRPTIKHTGSGIAFDLDGSGGTSSRMWNMRVENIAVEGNASTTTGFRFKRLHHSTFRNLRVLSASATGTGFRTEWTVASLYEALVCTSNENNSSATLPLKGIAIDAAGSGLHTEDCTF